jgi:tetratricopeptide (TPR) repeat protein
MQEAQELKNRIDTFLNSRKYKEAFDELESQFSEFAEKGKDNLYLLAEIAGSYINLGSEAYKKEAVIKGLKLFNDNKEVLKEYIREDSIDYCLGNGYHALYKISIHNNTEFFPKPDAVREYLFDAKQAYLKSFKKLDLKNLDQYSIQVLTNLGNNLNHSGRIVEALQLFDTVLKFNPNFPQALVSKADGLLYMLRAANTEITISLFLEVYNLFTKALKNPIHLDVIKKTVKSGLQKSKEFLQANNFDFKKIGEEEELNKLEYQKHSKETKYYLDNFLNLSEHGLYCKCNGAKIDNLVIGYPGLITNDKKIIHLEMLHNRIKSEFSLSRSLYFDYLFKENNDNVHYEDLSFDIHNGVKYEKLRTSFRLCFGILDKIAEGICYLFDLDVGENENIYFESFWQHYKEKSDRWEKINSFKNIHLTALFSIACDLNKKNGEFGFYKVWRNKIEHGIFSITESSDSKLNLISDKNFSAHTSKEDFEIKTKHLLQLTRSAIFSYVFCAREELINKNEKARR